MDDEDILVWSEGTWCYGYELCEMTHMSDDYLVLCYDTPEYNLFCEINC